MITVNSSLRDFQRTQMWIKFFYFIGGAYFTWLRLVFCCSVCFVDLFLVDLLYCVAMHYADLLVQLRWVYQGYISHVGLQIFYKRKHWLQTGGFKNTGVFKRQGLTPLSWTPNFIYSLTSNSFLFSFWVWKFSISVVCGELCVVIRQSLILRKLQDFMLNQTKLD